MYKNVKTTLFLTILICLAPSTQLFGMERRCPIPTEILIEISGSDFDTTSKAGLRTLRELLGLTGLKKDCRKEDRTMLAYLDNLLHVAITLIQRRDEASHYLGIFDLDDTCLHMEKTLDRSINTPSTSADAAADDASNLRALYCVSHVVRLCQLMQAFNYKIIFLTARPETNNPFDLFVIEETLERLCINNGDYKIIRRPAGAGSSAAAWKLGQQAALTEDGVKILCAVDDRPENILPGPAEVKIVVPPLWEWDSETRGRKLLRGSFIFHQETLNLRQLREQFNITSGAP